MRESHKDVRAQLADLAADQSSMRLSGVRRALILSEAVRATAPARQERARGVVSFHPVRVPAYAWAAAMVLAFLLVGGGYLWKPVAVQSSSSPSALVSAGPDLRVVQQGNDVVLEWENGGRSNFTLKKATSARDVREAQGMPIQGHRYVDRSPSDARIVYYVVE